MATSTAQNRLLSKNKWEIRELEIQVDALVRDMRDIERENAALRSFIVSEKARVDEQCDRVRFPFACIYIFSLGTIG